MRMCRVLGPVVATVKHPHFEGRAMMVVQALDEHGAAIGSSFLALDDSQSGVGDVVLVLTEGTGVRQITKNPDGSVRSLIVGIVDAVSLGGGA